MVRSMATGDIGLAETKLRPPAPPTRLVERTRLHVLLDDAVGRAVPLVLASAPAGSGKSTLLAAWASRHSGAVAWLQVEETDSDPARFWSALVAAIGRPRPAAAARLTPVVIGSAGDDATLVPAIVNELVGDDERLVIVVDDYHLIDSGGVHRGMERLIELCPPQVTIVLATRVDPPFRLGRLRVRNRLSEVRARDLRFAADEATPLLGPAGGRLPAGALDDLCARTEGWAAGLVLAGLSLERSADPARFVEDFRGDDQLVVGYLSDELLANVDAADRERLLETSVLDRLSGPLVDAVTASSGGARWLTETADRNQLVVRLDSTGEWFRYHHLLRDLLMLEASRAVPERLPELHARAAAWFESQGDPARAVEHRLAAHDVEAAMRLMWIVGPDLLGRGQIKTLRGILDRIGSAAAEDTACALLWGWCEYLTGRYGPAEHWLDTALAVAPPSLDRMVAMPLRINVSLGRGDVTTALSNARLVSAAGDLATRPAELATATGAAYTWAGLRTEARSALEIAVARSTVEQRLTAHCLALVSRAIVEMDDGSAAGAHAAAVRAISAADSFGLAGYHGIAPAFAVRARTEPDPEHAKADAAHALELARRAATDLGLAFVLTTCADTLLDLGEPTGADLLTEARAAVGRCVDPGIVGRYLSRTESRHRLGSPPVERPASLVEHLTEREVAVLRFLPTQLSLRHISAELYVSLNTVKTHCSAIYRKLGVGDRRSAVQTARELGLL
jgi:LuxR family maltose regulon positive regulatory protein